MEQTIARKKWLQWSAVPLVVLAVLLGCLTFAGSANASTGIQVKVDGSTLDFDVPAQAINDYTYVPLRGIFEALGAEVDWDEAGQSIAANKDGASIYLQVGKKQMTVNGKQTTLEVAPLVRNYRTLVPVRAVAEAFGCQVDWDGANQQVLIQTGDNSGSTTGTDTLLVVDKDNSGTKYNAEQIAALVADGVFYIEIYNQAGQPLGFGSGFFINSDGTAVTNYHVIDGAASAKVTTTDGKTYEVSTVLGYDADLDIALIKVNGSGFQALDVNTSGVAMGQKIYCIGNPLGLESTMSEGIISSAKRVINGGTYFQMTAPISGGSSGGAVVNEYAQVVGISAASVEGGQSLNLAVPTSLLNQVDRNVNKTLSQLFGSSATDTGSGKNSNSSGIPDVGDLTLAEQEPNDYINQAQTVKNGATIYGTLADDIDVDTYKIYLPKGVDVTLILAAGSLWELEDIEVAIANGDGDILSYSDYPGRRDSGIVANYRTQSEGYYYLGAYLYDGSYYENVPYVMYAYYE